MLNKLRQKLASAIGGGNYDVRSWVNASVQSYDTSGWNQSAYWAFDYRLAAESCTSWVYRCAMGNSQKAASIPLRLYAKGRGPGSKSLVWSAKGLTRKQQERLRFKGASSFTRAKALSMGEDMVELQEHPILTMLTDAPDQMCDGYELLTWVFLCLELTGNAYLFPQIDTRLGTPGGLFPMLPQWVLIKPSKSGSDRLIDGYAYGNFTARERMVDMDADEVMHCRYVNPTNMYYGRGKVEAAWDILGLQRSQRQCYNALFSNGLQPGMIVSSETIQNDDQARAMESRMNQIFRGTRNAGKLMLMSGKASVQPVSVNPKDISTNESALEEICAVFGYPITFILSADQGKANAESGESSWLRHTINPMLTTVEQWLNHSLLPMFGPEVAENCCLAFDNPVEEDSAAKENSITTLADKAIITRNEARVTLGLEPVEGGDDFFYGGKRVGEAEPDEDDETTTKSCSVVRYP
jgi:HK97 family phage portal protein